jgi:hypothetical protein
VFAGAIGPSGRLDHVQKLLTVALTHSPHAPAALSLQARPVRFRAPALAKLAGSSLLTAMHHPSGFVPEVVPQVQKNLLIVTIAGLCEPGVD